MYKSNKCKTSTFEFDCGVDVEQLKTEHEAERQLWLNAMQELRNQNAVLRNLFAMVLEDARDYGETNPAKVCVSTINRIRAELAEPITDG